MHFAQVNQSTDIVYAVTPDLNWDPRQGGGAPGCLYVPVQSQDENLIGKKYEGGQFVSVEPPKRTLLNYEEWLYTWTPDEWDIVRTAVREGTYNGNAIPQQARRRLQQFHDAVSVTASIDVSSQRYSDILDQFVAVGFITAQRKAELVSGV